jgi:sortase A
MMSSLKNALGRVLILAGALALLCWGYLSLQQLWFEKTASYVLEQRLLSSSRFMGRRKAKHNPGIVATKPGEILGRIEIPRIHLSAMILEGADSNSLRFGAGHVQGTALPGAKGNVAIAAHRDTFFRPLREVRPNDTILLTTVAGVYRYRVEGTEIVDPTDVQVLKRTRDSQLTLVTCYPFYYVGSAPKRFIVHTRLQV